jgi:hypothetical protein
MDVSLHSGEWTTSTCQQSLGGPVKTQTPLESFDYPADRRRCTSHWVTTGRQSQDVQPDGYKFLWWKPAPRPSGLGAGFHRPTLALLVGSSHTCKWTEVSWHCHVGKQSQYNLDEPSKLHTNSKGCNWCCLSFFLYLYMFDSSLCYGYCKRYSYVPPNLCVKPKKYNTADKKLKEFNPCNALHFLPKYLHQVKSNQYTPAATKKWTWGQCPLMCRPRR